MTVALKPEDREISERLRQFNLFHLHEAPSLCTVQNYKFQDIQSAT